MKIVIRLKIVQVLILVSGLGGAGILGAAAVSAVAEAKSQEVKNSVATTNPLKSRLLKDLPPEKIRSIVMNWPEQKKISAWNALNAEQQRTAHDIVHGETSPLRNFPPGLVPLVVSYMDACSITHSITKDELMRSEDPTSEGPPLGGIHIEMAPLAENHCYIYIRLHKDSRICYEFSIDETGERSIFTNKLNIENQYEKMTKPVAKLKGIGGISMLQNIPMKGSMFVGSAGPSPYIPWDTGRAIDCCIADYDAKEGGTRVEWSVYDRKEAEVMCALYGASKGYAVKQDEKTP